MFTIYKSLFWTAILGTILVINGCEQPSQSGDISSGAIIDSQKQKWRIDASKGDLNAAYSLAMFDSDSNEKREVKLTEVAQRGHFAAARDLCSAYSQGSLLGIQKNCTLAHKWCSETKKLNPNVIFDFDLEKECP